MWLKELNLLLNDSKNWTSFWIWFKEYNLFLKMTQRIEPSFERCDSKNWTFFQMWLKESNLLFFQYDSTNWTFFLHVIHVFKWFKDFLGKISQRIDFSYDSKNGTWRRDLKFMFLKLDSKNWTFFFLMTRRLEFFFQKLWRKDFFEKYDSKNWTFFVLKKWLKELNLFVWLKESNPFFNVTLFKKNQKIELFSKKMTQRIELCLTRTDRIGPFSWIWLGELKFFLGFFTCLQELNFFQKWRRELNPFFFEYDAKNWTLFSLNKTQRIWIFLYDAKNWTLFRYDSKNWTFFECNSKSWIFWAWLEERKLFF